jgi:hypothetical protein
MKIKFTPDQVQEILYTYLETKGINKNQVAEIQYTNKRSKGGVQVVVMYSDGVSTPTTVQQGLDLPVAVPDTEPEVIEALAQVPEAASLFS